MLLVSELKKILKEVENVGKVLTEFFFLLLFISEMSLGGFKRLLLPYLDFLRQLLQCYGDPSVLLSL